MRCYCTLSNYSPSLIIVRKIHKQNLAASHLFHTFGSARAAPTSKFLKSTTSKKQVKKVSAKARAKANHYPAQKTIWGGRLGPLGPGPPKLFLGWVVIGFGSGFGTDFFDLFF